MKDTGQASLSSVATLEQNIATRYPWRFQTMFDPSLSFLMSIDRPAAYFKTLFACFARLRPDELRRYSAAEVAQDTRMSKSNAERALAMLEADAVLICAGRGAAKKRRINHNIVWRDNVVQFNRERETFPDPHPMDGTAEDRFRMGVRAAQESPA